MYFTLTIIRRLLLLVKRELLPPINRHYGNLDYFKLLDWITFCHYAPSPSNVEYFQCDLGTVSYYFFIFVVFSMTLLHKLALKLDTYKILHHLLLMFWKVVNMYITIVSIFRYTGAFRNIGETLIPIIALISHILCYFNSAVNPVIYNFMSGKLLLPKLTCE